MEVRACLSAFDRRVPVGNTFTLHDIKVEHSGRSVAAELFDHINCAKSVSKERGTDSVWRKTATPTPATKQSVCHNCGRLTSATAGCPIYEKVDLASND